MVRVQVESDSQILNGHPGPFGQRLQVWQGIYVGVEHGSRVLVQRCNALRLGSALGIQRRG
ncbi:hypothetical protein D3C86_2112650 [compost metagenome]